MLELGASRIVVCHYCPSIVQHRYFTVPLTNHRLDGEHHARLHHARIVVHGCVEDRGRPVEVRADPVARDARGDAVRAVAGARLDGLANVREPPAGAARFDPRQRALPGDGQQVHARFVDPAHGVRRATVAVHAVEVDGHVHRHEVAVEQRPVVRHAVAHDVVDGRAHGLPETLVVQRRRVRVVADDQVVREPVHVVGGDARPGQRPGAVQHEPGQLAALPQQPDPAGVVHLRRRVLIGFVGDAAGFRVRRRPHVGRHRPRLAHVARAPDRVVDAETRRPEHVRPQRLGPRSEQPRSEQPPSAAAGREPAEMHVVSGRHEPPTKSNPPGLRFPSAIARLKPHCAVISDASFM